MQTRRLLQLVAFLSIAISQTAAAWGNAGHKTVARIAWANMTPAARTAAISLLMAAPSRTGIGRLRAEHADASLADERWFVAVATWPDIVRSAGPSHVYHHAPWHFADFFWRLSPNGLVADIPDLGPDVVNAGERLHAFDVELKGKTVADSLRAIELAWVLHLTGDIHQPLHTSSRVTTSLPDGDRGGNSIKFTNRLNLHSYWDHIIDSADPQDDDEDDDGYIDRMAVEIQAKFPKARLAAAIGPRDFESWEQESLKIAKAQAYKNVRAGRTPSEAYETAALKTAQVRIALAGYRLAALLNDILT